MPAAILGLGVDLVEVERIERALARHGQDFLEEILHPAELEECRRHPQALPFYAALFAAKEALFKALGTGRSGKISWHDVEVTGFGRGGGALVFHGETARLAGTAGVRRAHLSLSFHRGGRGARHAVALVLLESDGGAVIPSDRHRP